MVLPASIKSMLAMYMSPLMQKKFDSYPTHIRLILLNIRDIILQVADREQVAGLEETLKWGQPSYIAKSASSIRIDWSHQDPGHYRIYFICNTTLLSTFRELYPTSFHYEKNRAIVLALTADLPLAAFTHCISMAFNYHKIKHLPLLGN